MRYVGTRTSETNPLRSIHASRPAHVVFGHTAEQQAEFARTRAVELARHALTCAEAVMRQARAGYVQARREIGEANRGISRGLHYPHADAARRRSFRSIAFRAFNLASAVLRRAERQQAEAQAALLALTPSLPVTVAA